MKTLTERFLPWAFYIKRHSLLKKYVIEKSCTKLKFTLILQEFRFVQRVVGVQRAKPLVAGQFDL